MAKRVTVLEVRKSNRNHMIRLLHQQQQMSKQEIAVALNLSMPTVNQILKELEALKLIEYRGSFESTGGRKAKKVTFVAEAKVAIGLELCAGFVRFVVMDLSANVIYREKQDLVFENIENYKKELADFFCRFLVEQKIDPEKVLGVAVAVPGTFITTEQWTIIEQSPSLQFKSIIAQDLVKDIPFDCTFYNDADAAGIAELWHNEAPRSFVYLSIKNGVGGSLLFHNHPFYGANRRAGELGHMTIVKDGKLCACGKKGCLEAYTRPEQLVAPFGCDLATFFQQVSEKQPDYVTQLEEYLQYLAVGINNIRMIFDCDVVLGGEINEFLVPHMPVLKKILEERNMFYDNADYLKLAYYQADASAIGAALVHVRAYLDAV